MVQDAFQSEPVSSLHFPDIAVNCIFVWKLSPFMRRKWRKSAILKRDFPSLASRDSLLRLQGKAASQQGS